PRAPRSSCRAGLLRYPPEKVVECPDRPAEQGRSPGQKVVLDPVDVRPVRDTQKRVSVESFEVAIEETRHFARVRGAHQESERHLLDSRRLPGEPLPPGSALSEPFLARNSYAAAFGLRPLRAAARPGIPPAQSSHRSAALAPLRAAVPVTRIPPPSLAPTAVRLV